MKKGWTPTLPSEYDPLFTGSEEADEALADVRGRFEAAGKPFLRSPWTWTGWAVILPSAALATGAVGQRFGPSGVLMLWSLAILLGGLVETVGIFGGNRPRPTPLARWVLHTQGNLSLVAIALSALLLFAGAAWALPGLWLILIGHSFYVLGGLAFPPFRIAGLIY